MHTEDFLREVTALRGLSGDEGEVAQYIAKQFAPLCDSVQVDAMNNVIAHIKGEGPRVVFCAHSDEIGLMVVDIEEDGCLRLGNVGGVDPRILPGQRVWVHGKQKLLGIIGAKPPHLMTQEDRKNNYQREDLYADIGYPVEKVRELVQIGDQVQLEHRYTELLNNQVAVKTCDDRACVAMLYEAMKRLKALRPTADLYFVATSQEEVGTRGAMTAAFALQPDYAVALDVCHADTPGAPQGSTVKIDALAIGRGPYLHPMLFDKLSEVAKENNITLQPEVMPRSTSTDADALSGARAGVPTALLELPLRYMHTTVETISLDVLKQGGRLLSAFAAAVDASWEDELWT